MTTPTRPAGTNPGRRTVLVTAAGLEAGLLAPLTPSAAHAAGTTAPGGTGTPSRLRLPVPTGPYLSPVLRPVYETALGLPAGTLAIDTHADASARPLPARGVLLLSGGLGLPTAFQTAHA